MATGALILFKIRDKIEKNMLGPMTNDIDQESVGWHFLEVPLRICMDSTKG